MRLDSWQDQEGNKRSKLYVVGDNWEFVGGGAAGAGGGGGGYSQRGGGDQGGGQGSKQPGQDSASSSTGADQGSGADSEPGDGQQREEEMTEEDLEALQAEFEPKQLVLVEV